MIERNGTKYINEPHAGGGNPILAIDESSEDAIFNDILGTSLGVVKNGGYSAIDKTSFGADSTDKSSFFTGKPYVEDLGYAFLFRNYRADLGKWQMRDLIGYPDGWNNLVYCNNSITMWVDLLGGKVFWAARDLKGSPIGNHHFLLYIPDSPSNFSGETIDLGGGKKGFTQGGFKEEGMLVKRDNDTTDVKATKEYFNNDTVFYKPDYDFEIHEIPAPQGMTDTDFIRMIQNEMNSYNNKMPFSLIDDNCATLVNSVLKNIGIDDKLRETLGEFKGLDWGEEKIIPKKYFE